MNFFSVKEFFYKLNTIGFILLLLPLVVFVYLYTRAITTEPAIGDESQHDALLLILVAVVLVDLTIVHWLWRTRMNRLKRQNELARKMEGYFMMVIVRNGMYAASSLLMALGFYLSESLYFTGVFLVLALLMMIQWPRPAAFCDHLDLRGSDRDMVMNNRDLYRKPPIR